MNCSPCFRIEPSKGRIEEEESLQFTMHFLSNKSGDFRGNLFLEYETGISRERANREIRHVLIFVLFPFFQVKKCEWISGAPRKAVPFESTEVVSEWKKLS